MIETTATAVEEQGTPVPMSVEEPPAGAKTDDAPALAGVLPEQSEEHPGVDMSTLPEFASLAGQMPSARFHVKRQLADIAASMPEGMIDGEEQDQASMLGSMDKLDEAVTAMENLVLERAVDREAMVAWLTSQDAAEDALFAAFGVLSEQLGN